MLYRWKNFEMSSYIALLYNRNFLLFFLGSTTSALGSDVMQIVLALTLLKGGYAPGALGYIYAAEGATMTLSIAVAGVFGDRLSRRQIMIFADLLRCSSQFLFAMAILLTHPSITLLACFAALLGLGNAFFSPAATGTLVSILDARSLNSANNLLSFVAQVTSVLGPLLAGLLIEHSGTVLAVFFDAISYAISAFCLYYVTENKQKAPLSSFWEDARAGCAEFYKHKWLWAIAIQLSLAGFLLFAPFAVFGPMIVVAKAHGAPLLGAVASASALGGILGNIAITRIRFKNPLVLFEACLLVFCLPPLALAISITTSVFLMAIAACGFAGVVMGVVLSTAMQTTIPESLQSRASGFFSLVVLALAPFGLMLSPIIAQIVGVRGLLLLGPILLAGTIPLVIFCGQVRRYQPNV